MSDTARFVTFPLGVERYALDSCQVKELLMPSRVHSFPHTMRAIEGVLVRRGNVIPVCDLCGAFGYAAGRSFYVVAQCNYAGRIETIAFPVSGDCQLVQGQREVLQDVTFVTGLLRTEGSTIPLLDLDQIVAHCIQSVSTWAGERKP